MIHPDHIGSLEIPECLSRRRRKVGSLKSKVESLLKIIYFLIIMA